MSHLRWALPFTLSFGLFACGAEDSSTPTPAGEPDASNPAPDSQDSSDEVVEDIGGKVEELGGEVEDAAESAMAEADGLIEKVTAYLGENKLELAKKAFAQLEALSDKLPASYQAQIEKIRSLVEANGLGDKAGKVLDDLGGFGGGD